MMNDSRLDIEFISNSIDFINTYSANKPLILHTDLLKIINAGKLQSFINKRFAYRILDYLITHLKSSHIFIPTFDYSYCKTGVFDLKSTETSCGSLSKEAIINFSEYRTCVPVFSHIDLLGKQGPFHNLLPEINAFGASSFYEWITNNKGLIFFWGCPLSNSNTYMHHVESVCNVPYRYSKLFHGYIHQDTNILKTQLDYYVRPEFVELQYIDQGYSLLKRDNSLIHDPNLQIEGFQSDKFLSCIAQEIQQDEFILLDNNTRLALNTFYEKSNEPVFEVSQLPRYKVISDINFDLLFRDQFENLNYHIDFEYAANLPLALENLIDEASPDYVLIVLPSFNSIGLGRLCLKSNISRFNEQVKDLFNTILEKFSSMMLRYGCNL